MDLLYLYSSKDGNLPDIEVLVDFSCTWGGYIGDRVDPPEGPEFEIDNIFYQKDSDKLSLEEEKSLIQFLSEDQSFYERMCERYWDTSFDYSEYE